MDYRRVDQCVERLCRKGCRAVWSDIDALEAGRVLPEVKGLSPAEMHAVLRELKSVMSVYRDSCVPG